MSALLGLNAKAYRCTTTRATWGAADGNGMNGGAAHTGLDEITQAKDVKFSIDKGSADVSIRGNNGWASTLATLKDGEGTITMVYDPADADFVALMASYLLNTLIPLALLDNAKTVVGTMGIWADFSVTKMEKDEALTEGQMVTFTIKPGLSAVAPQWVKVTS
jgi:hypothetical protein